MGSSAFTPNLVYSERAAIVDADKDSCWTLKGNWQDAENWLMRSIANKPAMK